MENEIFSKGYHNTAGYVCGGDPFIPYDSDCMRTISYGYRYQANWHEEQKKTHSERPRTKFKVQLVCILKRFTAPRGFRIAQKLLKIVFKKLNLFQRIDDKSPLRSLP